MTRINLVDPSTLHSKHLLAENRVCYYLRNMNELDRLMKLDKLAKETA